MTTIPVFSPINGRRTADLHAGDTILYWTLLTDPAFGDRQREGSQKFAICRCVCGKEKRIRITSVVRGSPKSCKCIMSAEQRDRAHTHGHTGSVEYHTWEAMKDRCLNPHNLSYHHYGGRGIRVCQRWIDSFVDFLADMGARPPGRSIDRINVNGNYCPENCRWADSKTQRRNTRSNHLLTFNGETMCLVEWAEKTGLPQYIITNRLRDRWHIDEILTTPVGGRRSRNSVSPLDSVV